MVALEELLSESVGEDPQGLSNGVPPFLPVGLGPEEIGQPVPGEGEGCKAT